MRINLFLLLQEVNGSLIMVSERRSAMISKRERRKAEKRIKVLRGRLKEVRKREPHPFRVSINKVQAEALEREISRLGKELSRSDYF